MEERTQGGVTIKDFGGAITDADPRDIPRNHFQRLQNWALEAPGYCISRRGLTFRQTSPFTANLIAAKRSHAIFQVGLWTWLVHDLANCQFRAIDATGGTTTNRTFQPSPTWHVDAKMGFAETSGGELVICNGTDRPWKYNGQDGTSVSSDGPACAMGIDPPTGSPAGTPGSSGNCDAGTYVLAYRFVDRYGNPSVLSPTVEVTTTAGQKITWTFGVSSGLDSSPRVTRRQLFRTLVDDASTFYLVATIDDNASLTYVDTLSDDDLGDNESLPLTSGGILVANRFVVPPSHKQIPVWHEDRLFFFKDGRHATGTLAFTLQTANITGATNATPIVITSAGHGLANGQKVTIASVGGNTAANGTWVVANKATDTFELQGSVGNGSYTSGGTWTRVDGATFTGTSTVFGATMIGWEIFLNTTAGVPFTVVTVASETSFTVSPAPTASFSGVSFVARPARTERNKVYFSEPEEPESVPQSQNNVLVQFNSADAGDEIVGGFTLSTALYAMKTRSIHSIDYVRQGKVSAGSAPVANRGGFNHWCCARASTGEGGDVCFLMDRYGMWMFPGQGEVPIGEGFANYWRDGIIDFSKTDNFFVAVNRRTSTVRFFVVLVADGSTYPKFCFCYSWARKAWWTETRPWQMQGAGNISENGHDTYYELPLDYPMVYDDGYPSDGIQTAVRGVVASYDSGTGALTATTSVFTSAMLGVPVVLTGGNGEQGVGVITAYTSGTAVTVSSGFHSLAVPAAGDAFAIGGIPCSGLTPQYDLAATGNRSKVEVAAWYRPTTASGTYLGIRHYYDHRSTGEASKADLVENGEFVEHVNGSTIARSNMYSLKRGDVPQTGVARKDLSGSTHVGLPNARLLSIEFLAVAVEERLRITQFDIPGVS